MANSSFFCMLEACSLIYSIRSFQPTWSLWKHSKLSNETWNRKALNFTWSIGYAAAVNAWFLWNVASPQGLERGLRRTADGSCKIVTCCRRSMQYCSFLFALEVCEIALLIQHLSRIALSFDVCSAACVFSNLCWSIHVMECDRVNACWTANESAHYGPNPWHTVATLGFPCRVRLVAWFLIPLLFHCHDKLRKT